MTEGNDDTRVGAKLATADVRQEPIELLHQLLVSLFKSGEAFRQWVSRIPRGEQLVTEFPGLVASTATVISDGLEVIHKRGHLDADFFARLCVAYPRRRDEIEPVATAWGICILSSPQPPVLMEPLFVFCRRCGATDGVKRCPSQDGHEFGHFKSRPFCRHCGVLAGEPGRCHIHRLIHDFAELGDDDICTRCGTRPGQRRRCTGIELDHQFNPASGAARGTGAASD